MASITLARPPVYTPLNISQACPATTGPGMSSPQSPPPPDSPSHAYPSPRSKSPPISRLVPKLPSIQYPLLDIKDFSFTHVGLELPPSTPRLGGPECQEKNQTHSCDVASGTVLRSPIPLFSHRSPPTPFSFRSSIFEPAPPPDSASPPSFEASRSAPPHKWTKRRPFATLRSPPPSPTRRARKYMKRSPPSPSLQYSRPQQCPAPFPHAIDPAPPLPPLATPPHLFLPASSRKKRTKRELAELQWQVTVHRSLAWRVRGGRERSEDGPFRALNLEDGGLMIRATAHPHWTHALDRRLVTRLWEKLLAQGCKPVESPAAGSSSARRVPFPVSTVAPGIPFPTLAPPIQLESPMKANSAIPRRARVSALAFSSPRVRARELSLPPSPATPPKGTLAPAQLVAQTMLRRSQARAKPIKRGSVPRRGPFLGTLGEADVE